MSDLGRHAVVVFRVGFVHCAIPSGEVLQIVLPPRNLIRIPWARPEVVGAFGYQSRLATAISLPRKFGQVRHQDRQSGLVMLSECQANLVGFWVDDVLGVLTKDASRHQPMPWPLSTALFDGVFVEDGGELIFTTQTERLYRMPCERLVVPDAERRVVPARPAATTPAAPPTDEPVPGEAPAEAPREARPVPVAVPVADKRRLRWRVPEREPVSARIPPPAQRIVASTARREPRPSPPTAIPAAWAPVSAPVAPRARPVFTTPAWEPGAPPPARASKSWGWWPPIAAAVFLVALGSLVVTIGDAGNAPSSPPETRTVPAKGRDSPRDIRSAAPPAPAAVSRTNAPVAPAPPSLPSRQVIIHTVKRGDTLWDITEHYLGNPFRYPEVAEWSGIEDPHWIEPGDLVRLIVEDR